MARMPRASYCWPGLPLIAVAGQWAGLGVAVGFAVLLNAAIATTFLWYDVLSPGARRITWAAVGIAWLAGAAYSRFRLQALAALEESPPATDGFIEAQEHYLKGNWYEAEQILAAILMKNPRDLDARLMLATLLRHTGRHDAAGEQLDRMERLEGCPKWQLEISRERRKLASVKAERAEAGSDVPDSNGD